MTSRSRSEVQVMLTASQSGNSVTNAKDGGSLLFDSSVPEAYATLDAAQQEHAKYNSNQVRNPEDGSVQGTEDPLYEFDGVSPSEGSVSVTGVTVGGGSEGGGSGGGVVRYSSSRPRKRYEAKNVLYEDNELPQDTLKHRSLHAGSYNMYPEKSGGSYITCRCKTRTLVVTFFTALALLLAVAALVLSILLWFGVYDTSSSSSSSPLPSDTPTTCNCPTEAEVEKAKSDLSVIRQRLETLKNRSTQYVIQRDVLSQQVSWLQSNLSYLSDNLSSLPTERKLSIPSFNVFDGCTTTQPEVISCTIPDVPDGAIHEPCLTDPELVEQEGTFLLSAECRKTGDELPEAEKVATTLEIFHNGGQLYMRCRCTRILDSPTQAVDSSLYHSCSLIATRCPLTISINATLAWHPVDSQ